MVKLSSLGLKRKEQPVDPNRAELAVAIEAINKLEREKSESQTASSRAKDLLDKAIQERNAASQAVNDARDSLKSRMLNSAQTGATFESDGALAKAHARLTLADETLAAAQATIDALESSTAAKKEENDAVYARRDKAIAKIFYASCPKILVEAAELRDLYMAKLLELQFAGHKGLNANPVSTDQDRKINHILSNPVPNGTYPYLDYRQSFAAPIVGPWAATAEALKTNPDAPLPGEGA
ncbi:hypothetical protein EV217_2867 [Phyllobacterium myrsinacearum]|uniref:hypothetical protein n=1 Tax=Phyllobacterium myrsinacearum TaxID=28101 RepID=UPI00102885E8|nr:hypothetical protein [Phyllobacterium myrsinacearum]RZS82054.1 hypothetical protein EV217_2867 [Phyllobacterium myrsinacearum]